MTQAQYAVLALFLESDNGLNQISNLLDGNPETRANTIKAKLDENPRTKKIVDGLDAETLDALTEELIYFNLQPAEMRGFKAGVDFVLSVIGEKPIFGGEFIKALEANTGE